MKRNGRIKLVITSKDVFAKRKEGCLDEAFQMAVELMKNPQRDEWDVKAFAWCIISLINRDARLGHQQNLPGYSQELENLKIDPSDEILSDKRQNALKLCTPNGLDFLKAKTLSKEGRHQESVNFFRKILNNGDHSEDVQTGLAWELYRLAKAMIEQEPPNSNGAKKHLNDYFKLKVDRPSLLHSCFLQLADKLAKENKLNMGAFARIWGLENLRPEDYAPFKTDDGNVYPSLTERVVLHASKDAVSRSAQEDLHYILPFINDCIIKFPDNFWLKYRKAKVLMSIGLNEEVLSLGIEVVKSKFNEYWAWELLGDIYKPNAPETALSCYCKALLCSKETNFVSKVKIKLAELLIEIQDYSRAKFEIEEIITYKVHNKKKVPDSAESLKTQAWYEATSATASNREFYTSHAPVAEELLYSNLPWTDGIIGECFTIDEKPSKPRRKLYIHSSSIPFEVSIPESKVLISGLKPGMGIKIKGEKDKENRFQVYILEKRDTSTDWDIFGEHIGVVDHINTQKKLIHFIVSYTIDSVIQFSELEDRFLEGEAIAVRVHKYTSKRGTRYRTLTAKKTTKSIPKSILKAFEEEVREKDGMGFTVEEGIFIPPPIVNANNIKDGDRVSGKAIINFNKKKLEWSWKAISIDNVCSSYKP